MASKLREVPPLKISLGGELTASQANEIVAYLTPVLASNRDVDLDLSHVTLMDMTGAQLMVATKIETRLRKTRLNIINCSPVVLEALDVSELLDFLEVQPMLH